MMILSGIQISDLQRCGEDRSVLCISVGAASDLTFWYQIECRDQIEASECIFRRWHLISIRLLNVMSMSGVITHNEESRVNENIMIPNVIATVIENMKKATSADVSIRQKPKVYSSFVLIVPELLHPEAAANMADSIAVTVITAIISISGIFPCL